MALIASRAVYLAAGLLTLSCETLPVRAATPEDGRRAYEAGHFTDAMGIWAELSHSGNAEAEFGLGLLYDLGNGAPADAEAAFSWYKMAADAGLPAAQFNVAAMYDSGRGVVENRENAALWYAKAAAQGHHRAQFDLGQLYEEGDGVPRNPDAARAWLRKAADGGIKAAGARLKVLEAAPTVRPAGSLSVVALMSPARDDVLAFTNEHPSIELVWKAPPEPEPVYYEVQVRELGGPTLLTVFTASMGETATVVQLPVTPDFYVWKVDVVGQDGSHAPGDWSWFSTGPVHPAAQALAAAPSVPGH